MVQEICLHDDDSDLMGGEGSRTYYSTFHRTKLSNRFAFACSDFIMLAHLHKQI